MSNIVNSSTLPVQINQSVQQALMGPIQGLQGPPVPIIAANRSPDIWYDTYFDIQLAPKSE